MKAKHSYPLVLLLLIVTMSVLRLFSGGQVESASVVLSRAVAPPLKQRASERSFKRLTGERTFCIGDSDSTGSGPQAHISAVVSERELYILDFGNLTLKKYSANGEFIGDFGLGKGPGRGQFMSISDVKPMPNGELWVADVTGKKIDIFSPDGSLRNTIRPSRPPYRLLPDGRSEFTLMLPLSSEHLFGNFQVDGRMRTEFGKLVDDRLDGLALDGWIGRANDGSLLYVPYYFGWIASYSPAGELKYMVETVAPVSGPSIRRSRGGMIWLDPDSRISTKSASISGGSLYLLSGNASGSRVSQVVDVYSTKDGSYRYSFEAPEAGTMALMREGSLITVNDTHVCQWKVSPAEVAQRAAF